ncbi:MAG: hypothetical protein KC466_08900 [Myxococcales bacterium]|nr:hypothetical protein [Myxococcales bacterium]
MHPRIHRLAFGALAVSLVAASAALAGYKGHPLVPARDWDRAVITYEVQSEQGNGTEVRYIDGLKMRTEMHLKAAKDAPETVHVEISLPDFVYRYQVGQTTGQKVTNPQGPILTRYQALSKEEQKTFTENADKFTSQVFAGLAGGSEDPKKNTQVVAGQECQIVEMAKLKTCLWRAGGNLPLKTSQGTAYMSEASKIEVGAKVPADLFEVPKGIEFTTDQGTEAMAQQVAGMMFEMIKRGGPPRPGGAPVAPSATSGAEPTPNVKSGPGGPSKP